ncbi:MAG: glycosyl transferase family 8 [Acidimicrobiia bacterium]|nr:MAG: glycosyl transferase family 8 [Acidimicrobiia bacterium]
MRDWCILVGADEDYAMGLAVTLDTALGGVDGRVEVWVVDGGMTGDTRRRIARVVDRRGGSIRWHRLDKRAFDGVRVAPWGSVVNYFPLLAPSLVDTGLVLALDSDLLVRDPLEELVGTWERGSAPVGAVLDFGIRTVEGVFGPDVARELQIDPTTPYFNSGVMLIDVEVWREMGISERAASFAKEHGDVMRFSDQDALNAVVAGRWVRLDDRWNVQVGNVSRAVSHDPEAAFLLSNPGIVHYSGPAKPWTARYWGPWRSPYLEALRRSGWFDSTEEWAVWRMAHLARTPWGLMTHLARRSRPRVARLARRLPGGTRVISWAKRLGRRDTGLE